MEVMEWATIVLISGFLSGLFGLIFAYGTLFIRDYRLTKLEKEVERLGCVQTGEYGRNKKVEKQEMMQQAMLEAAAIMKNSEITDKQGAIVVLATKYPSLALDLIRKGI